MSDGRKIRSPDKPGVPMEYTKLALEDVVRFQSQQVDLLHRGDTKAMRLMALYIAVAGALTTQTISLHYGNASPVESIYFLGGTAAVLMLGAYFALRALWVVPIYLAGRKPDFWLWVLEYDISSEKAIRAYIEQAQQSIEHNERANNSASKLMRRAYICGPLSLLFGAACLLTATASPKIIDVVLN